MSKLSRRSLVAGAAAAVPAAVALPIAVQAAAEPDPIFAAIEAYRQAYAEHGAALDAQDDRYSELYGRGLMSEDDEEWNNDHTQRLEDRVTRASHAQAEAARKLCHTAPTTLAGLAAVLSFIINGKDNGDEILTTFVDDEQKYLGYDEAQTCERPLFKTVLRSVEQMARQS